MAPFTMNGNMRRVVGCILLAWMSGASPQAPAGPPTQLPKTDLPKPNAELPVDSLKSKETDNVPSKTPISVSTEAINQISTQPSSTPQKPNGVSEDTKAISSIPSQTEPSKTDVQGTPPGDKSDYKPPTQTASPTSQDIPSGQISKKDHSTSAKPDDTNGAPPKESQPPTLTTSPGFQGKQENPNDKPTIPKENEKNDAPIDKPEKLIQDEKDDALQKDSQPATTATSSSPKANEPTPTAKPNVPKEAEKGNVPTSKAENPTPAKEAPEEKQSSLEATVRMLDEPKDESPPESKKDSTKSLDVMPEKPLPSDNDGVLQKESHPPTIAPSSASQAKEPAPTAKPNVPKEAEKGNVPTSKTESPTPAKEAPEEKQPSLEATVRILDEPKDESPPGSPKPSSKPPDTMDDGSQYKRESNKESAGPKETSSDKKEATGESDLPSPSKEASPPKPTATESSKVEESSRKSSPNEKPLNEERAQDVSKQGKDLPANPEGDQPQKETEKGPQENKVQESLKEVPSTEKDQYEDPDQASKSEKGRGSDPEKGDKVKDPDAATEPKSDSTKDPTKTGPETAKNPADKGSQDVNSEKGAPTPKPSGEDPALKEPAKVAENFDGKPNFGPADGSPQDIAKPTFGEKDAKPQKTDVKADNPSKINTEKDASRNRGSRETPRILKEETKAPNDSDLTFKKQSEKGAEKVGDKVEPPRVPMNDAKEPIAENKVAAEDVVDGKNPSDPEERKKGSLPDTRVVDGVDADIKDLPSKKKVEGPKPGPEGKPRSKEVNPDNITKDGQGKDQNPESPKDKQVQGDNPNKEGQDSPKAPSGKESQGIDSAKHTPAPKSSEEDAAPKQPAKDAENFDGKPNFGPTDGSPQEKTKPISSDKEAKPQNTDIKADDPSKINTEKDIGKSRKARETPRIPKEEPKAPNDSDLTFKKESEKGAEKVGGKVEPPRVPKNDVKEPITEKKAAAEDVVDGKKPSDPEEQKKDSLPPDTWFVDGEDKPSSPDTWFVDGVDADVEHSPSKKKVEASNPDPEGKPGSKDADPGKIAKDGQGKDQSPESPKDKQVQGDNPNKDPTMTGPETAKNPADKGSQDVNSEKGAPTPKPSGEDPALKESAKVAENFDGKPNFGPADGSPQEKDKPISSDKEAKPQNTDIKADDPSKINTEKDIGKSRKARETPRIPKEETRAPSDNDPTSKKESEKGAEKVGDKVEPPRVPKNDVKEPITEKKAAAEDVVDGKKPSDSEERKKDSLPSTRVVDGVNVDVKNSSSKKKVEGSNPGPEGKPGSKDVNPDNIAKYGQGKDQSPESPKDKQVQGDNPNKEGQDSPKATSAKESQGIDSAKHTPAPKPSEKPLDENSPPEGDNPISQEPTKTEPRVPTKDIPDNKAATGDDSHQTKDAMDFNEKPNFGSIDESSRDKNKPTPSEKEPSPPRTKDLKDGRNNTPTGVPPVKENEKSRDTEVAHDISNKDDFPNRKVPEKSAENGRENEEPKDDKKSAGPNLEKSENPKDNDVSTDKQLPPDTRKVSEERAIKPLPSEEIKPDVQRKPEGSDDTKATPKNKQADVSSLDREKPTPVADAQPSTSRNEEPPSLPTRLQPSGGSDPIHSKDSSRTSPSENSPTAQPSKADHASSPVVETDSAFKTSASSPAQSNESSKASIIIPTAPVQSPKENQASSPVVETDSASKTSASSPARSNESSKPSVNNPTAILPSQENPDSSSAADTNPVSKTSATAQPKESPNPIIAASTSTAKPSAKSSAPPVQTEPPSPSEKPQRLPDPVNTFVIEKGNVRLPAEQEPKQPPKDVNPSRPKTSVPSPTEDTDLEPTTPEDQPKPEPTAEEAPGAIPARSNPPAPSTSSKYIFSQPVYLKPDIKVTAEEAPVATATSLPTEEKLTPDKPSMIRGTDDNVVESDDVGFEIRLLNVRYMDLLDYPDKSKHISNALPQDLGFLTGQKSSKFHVIEMKPNNPNRLTSDQSIIVIISISNKQDGDAIPIMEALNHDIASKAEMLKDTIVLKLIDPSIIERGIQGFVLVNSSAKDRSGVPMDFDFISKASNTKEEAFGAVPNPLTNLDGPQTPWKPISDESGAINWATKSIALSLALTSALIYALLVLFRIHYPQHFMIR
ncbi:hypothetical protein DSO57_1033628 [Entomophthora muscae]|uniref:Uncharacterized protein n=1 Tax=Entomophthora muscae TaxID=34485 RepID=A0ACC2SNZ3_9FUNG|nr:hypothetical protein DSO57_1033628 [Entomophthora muscae]